MTSIKQQFDEIVSRLSPAALDSEFRASLERAYFSGYYACFMRLIAEMQSMDAIDRQNAMAAMHNELGQYFGLLEKRPDAAPADPAAN
jgi:hypothetical protein